jgi:hypothetical protein
MSTQLRKYACQGFLLSYFDAFAFFPSASIIALDAGGRSCTQSFAGL